MKAWRNAQLAALEAALSWLGQIAGRRGRRSQLPQHLQTGLAGEEAAYFFLRRQGFTVVARRWNDTPLPGDLDLIAWDGDLLCFIEVKTRTSHAVATAASAVDREKRRFLRRLARHYLRQLPNSETSPELGSEPGQAPPQTRFDIVSIYDVPGKEREIRHTPGAFGWSERG